ncbi:MAG: Gfo/Idh/MocA family oxidoreductase [Methylobacteriaceae bacterium]|nr:Gfo/Idh/MocA family oxidoreductase [Methylobacteriaceae bacterium]
MTDLPKLKFAAVGLDHRHIYDQLRGLLDIGAECAGFWTRGNPQPLAGFVERFPQIPRIDDVCRILEDPSVQLIACAAIPCDRAGLAVEAMRHGKDVMVDKPGIVTSSQLDDVKRVQRETGRIFSVNFTERFEVRAVTRAAELIEAGEIGRVLQTVGLGPHRLNRQLRPEWFFRKEAYGGILVDIASHQIEQFLFFARARDAEIVAARAGNLAHPGDPDFEDFGEVLLAAGPISGYVRVDWFTPDGLAAWGDGRLTILGTDGYIELRKYIDIAGRSGKDHLFLVNGRGTRYVDCSDADLPYYRCLARDVFERTETAMAQAHCFKVCELALAAQAKADATPIGEVREPGRIS